MRISDWSSDVCSSDLGEQAHAEVRAADAAAGVDPRAECEAEIARGRRAGEPRCFDQCVKTDVAALRHHLAALRDERAVEPLQLRDIGASAERAALQPEHGQPAW